MVIIRLPFFWLIIRSRQPHLIRKDCLIRFPIFYTSSDCLDALNQSINCAFIEIIDLCCCALGLFRIGGVTVVTKYIVIRDTQRQRLVSIQPPGCLHIHLHLKIIGTLRLRNRKFTRLFRKFYRVIIHIHIQHLISILQTFNTIKFVVIRQHLIIRAVAIL